MQNLLQSDIKGIVYLDVAAHYATKYGKDKIEELGKDIPNGEIDILLKDGTIIECKALYWPEQKIDKLKNKFKEQIAAFKAYSPTATIKFAFKDSVHPDIKKFLEDKGIIVEVI